MSDKTSASKATTKTPTPAATNPTTTGTDGKPTKEQLDKLEQLRVVYANAKSSGSADLEKAREAYQDYAADLLIGLSGKPDPTDNGGGGTTPTQPEKPTEGVVKQGGNQDPDTWTINAMRDNPAKFKIIDHDSKNIATDFTTMANASTYIEYYKWLKANPGSDSGSGGEGGGTVNPTGDKDQFGVLKIYKDKPGGETNTKFVGKEMTRHYASGKPSENSYEYTATASSNDHNSDVEFTCYEKINGFKSSPDTISDKETGPEHQDGAHGWVIAEFMTDGSAKATYETEYPHPNYQKIDPKPATTIGGSIVDKWFGHKAITYVKDGARWCESWIHFPVTNIDNIAAEQDKWRQYVKPFKVDAKFTKANGKLTTSRLDGINKGSAPDFKYTSVREISVDNSSGSSSTSSASTSTTTAKLSAKAKA
jgi:hypothetical protein